MHKQAVQGTTSSAVLAVLLSPVLWMMHGTAPDLSPLLAANNNESPLRHTHDPDLTPLRLHPRS